jgi:hypothetical protein
MPAQLGRINLLTPERVRLAREKELIDGAVVSLKSVHPTFHRSAEYDIESEIQLVDQPPKEPRIRPATVQTSNSARTRQRIYI